MLQYAAVLLCCALQISSSDCSAADMCAQWLRPLSLAQSRAVYSCVACLPVQEQPWCTALRWPE